MTAILLHRIDIPVPCTASWEAMPGDQTVRHCSSCNKNVFNLSAMPAADGNALLAANHSGELCVRFSQDVDGTVITGDRARAPAPGRWRALPAMAGGALLALAGAARAGDPPPPSPVMMGAPPAMTQAAPLPPVKKETLSKTEKKEKETARTDQR